MELLQKQWAQLSIPTWVDMTLVALICIVGWLIQHFIFKWIMVKNVTFLKNRQRYFQAVVLSQFDKAIRYAFMTIVVAVAMTILIKVPILTHVATKNFVWSIIVFFAFKGVYDVLHFYTKQPLALEGDEKPNVLLPFFLRIGKVIVMLLAMFTIASFWNFNLNGFLTGIGLTGVAIAFGIRDTLGHVFGGMSVALDNPFQIGDWIATEDQKIEGIIEDINLRSTLIQTSDKGLVYVPNAYLVNRPIYNLAKREKRKCEQFFHVAVDSNEEQLRNALSAIHKVIALHKQTEKELIHVFIDDLQATAYRILVRFYVTTNDTAVMLAVKQDILFAIRPILDEFSIRLVELEEESRLKK
ncbi:mechanosensitive ion channel family protein [Lysinibacillus piscis]|uniref:Mechanosensitive ion channel family protein n=1 Tax=Lysinibacillus piscis TaxID=2518931 RepID=A0ABQ5NJU8_9BACI|nr:mechanosensitive ion channel family protein [Lysinibacillus sp. KH24]GLC88633.1 hypothetical protein LYSBPC_17600 [Lysinibacillus sp. KH24]